METLKNGFWDYANRWLKDFPQEQELRWTGNWIENGYCAGCRFCCGPQDSDVPFPMPLLTAQSGAEARARFHLLDFRTAYLAGQGCKSDSPHGCPLTPAQKPVACGLFPIVFVNGGLYLYQNCPAVVFTPLIRFMEFARKAAEMLSRYSREELLHLCGCLTLDVLSRSYIDLRIRLIKDGKKTLIFE